MPNPQNLKSYKKGESGNPNGRPKGRTNRLTAYRRIFDLQLSPSDIKGMLEQGNITLANGITRQLPKSFSIEEALAFAQVTKALSGDTKAFQAVRDEMHGKIVQPTKDETVDVFEIVKTLAAFGINSDAVAARITDEIERRELESRTVDAMPELRLTEGES